MTVPLLTDEPTTSAIINTAILNKMQKYPQTYPADSVFSILLNIALQQGFVKNNPRK